MGSNAGLHTYCKHAWSDKFAHAHVHGYGLSFACQLVGCICIYHHGSLMFVSVQTVGMIFYLASVKFLKSVKIRCPPRRSRCMSCVSDNILLSIMVHKVIEDENLCQKCGRKYLSSQKNPDTLAGDGGISSVLD